MTADIRSLVFASDTRWDLTTCHRTVALLVISIGLFPRSYSLHSFFCRLLSLSCFLLPQAVIDFSRGRFCNHRAGRDAPSSAYFRLPPLRTISLFRDLSAAIDRLRLSRSLPSRSLGVASCLLTARSRQNQIDTRDLGHHGPPWHLQPSSVEPVDKADESLFG